MELIVFASSRITGIGFFPFYSLPYTVVGITIGFVVSVLLALVLRKPLKHSTNQKRKAPSKS